jgi:hypothetical protein
VGKRCQEHFTSHGIALAWPRLWDRILHYDNVGLQDLSPFANWTGNYIH